MGGVESGRGQRARSKRERRILILVYRCLSLSLCLSVSVSPCPLYYLPTSDAVALMSLRWHTYTVVEQRGINHPQHTFLWWSKRVPKHWTDCWREEKSINF